MKGRPPTQDRTPRIDPATGRQSGQNPTTFAHDPACGVRLSRTDAKNQSTARAYTLLGQLATRSRSRANSTITDSANNTHSMNGSPMSIATSTCATTKRAKRKACARRRRSRSGP